MKTRNFVVVGPNVVFTNDKVSAFYNSNFICAKIDAEKNKEMMPYAETDGILIFPT